MTDLEQLDTPTIGLSDDTDFSRLYAEFAPRVRGLVRRLLGPDDLVDDVVQETFLRGFNAGLHHEYRDQNATTSQWPWLAAVARNLCLDHLRRRQVLSFKPLDDAPFAPISAADDPEAEALNLGSSEGIAEVLESVSDRHRRVLVLKHVEGLSYRDIAKSEGMSVDALKSVLARARRAFRENYEVVASNRGFGIALGPFAALVRRLRSLRHRAAVVVDQAVVNALASAPLAAQAVATTIVVGLAALAGPALSSSSPSESRTETPALMNVLISSDVPGPIASEVGAQPVARIDPSLSAHVDTAVEVTGTTPADPDPTPVENATLPGGVSVATGEVVPVDDPPASGNGTVGVVREDDGFYLQDTEEIQPAVPIGPVAGGGSVGGDCPTPGERGKAMSVLCPVLLGEGTPPTG